MTKPYQDENQILGMLEALEDVEVDYSKREVCEDMKFVNKALEYVNTWGEIPAKGYERLCKLFTDYKCNTGKQVKEKIWK